MVNGVSEKLIEKKIEKFSKMTEKEQVEQMIREIELTNNMLKKIGNEY